MCYDEKNTLRGRTDYEKNTAVLFDPSSSYSVICFLCKRAFRGDCHRRKKTEAAQKTEEKKTEEKKTSETEEINHGDDVDLDVTPTDPAPEPVTEPATEQTTQAPSESTHMLDGKKVIFIGNSYTYYGNAVITNARSVLKQSKRMNNRGYFYQICKANGANVNVTNWTFGGHSLSDLFYNCMADRGCDNTDHKSYLTDRYYDYVFIQEHGATKDLTNDAFLKRVETVTDFFREANPDVKFFFLVQRRVYEHQLGWRSALKTLADKGITVVEWGALVDDVITGKTKVPGATLEYNQNTFIVNQSAKDGFHPNMLTGYVTAQMAYCAVTGDSAVGQRYDFCTDVRVNSAFSAPAHIGKYYKNGQTTNMLKVFESPEDMKGLQTLMDQYLAAHNYRNY